MQRPKSKAAVACSKNGDRAADTPSGLDTGWECPCLIMIPISKHANGNCVTVGTGRLCTSKAINGYYDCPVLAICGRTAYPYRQRWSNVICHLQSLVVNPALRQSGMSYVGGCAANPGRGIWSRGTPRSLIVNYLKLRPNSSTGASCSAEALSSS